MKILIVEDDPIMLMVITRLCEMLGHTTIAATDGLEGMKLVDSYSPNIVITDLNLPTKSGPEIISSIKENQDKKIPVILISSMPVNALKNQNNSFGADLYLVKPVSLESLRESLERLSKDIRYTKEDALVA